MRHHFLKDHIQKRVISLEFVITEHQLADIITKQLTNDRFCGLRRNIDFLDANALKIVNA